MEWNGMEWNVCMLSCYDIYMLSRTILYGHYDMGYGYDPVIQDSLDVYDMSMGQNSRPGRTQRLVYF